MTLAQKMIEFQLKEAGRRLLYSLNAAEGLLPLLDQVENCLSRVEQSPSESMLKALVPSARALISEELLRHSDVDVKVVVASCVSHITRITAPEAPFDDELMKEVFKVIVAAFEKLYDMDSPSYSKRVSILETVAKVRSCVLMLDLEFDDLILLMFHHFLNAIREIHPEDIFLWMETIMTLVLEESEDISAELLYCLLSRVKKNQQFSPVARRLGEKVIGNCARKIKPYLIQVVKSLSLVLDDYAEVVASVCLGSFIPKELERLNFAQRMVEECKPSESTASDFTKGDDEMQLELANRKEANHGMEESTKLLVSNDIVLGGAVSSVDQGSVQNEVDSSLKAEMSVAAVDEPELVDPHKIGLAQTMEPELTGQNEADHGMEESTKLLVSNDIALGGAINSVDQGSVPNEVDSSLKAKMSVVAVDDLEVVGTHKIDLVQIKYTGANKKKRVKRGSFTHSTDVFDHSDVELKKSDKRNTAPNENEDKTEFSSTTESHNEAIVGAPSPYHSHSIQDATPRNRGRPSKKNESAKSYSDMHASPSRNMETLPWDHISDGKQVSKDSKGNDVDTNMQKILKKKVGVASGNVDEVQKLDINSKKESKGTSDSDVKPLRSSGLMARGGNADDGESSAKLKEQGGGHQRKTPEEGDLRNINRKKKVSPVKVATKASCKDRIQVEHTPKMESKSKRSSMEKKKISPVKAATKASSKDRIQVENTPKMESKRKHSSMEKKKVSLVKAATKASSKDGIQVEDTPKMESKRKRSSMEKVECKPSEFTVSDFTKVADKMEPELARQQVAGRGMEESTKLLVSNDIVLGGAVNSVAVDEHVDNHKFDLVEEKHTEATKKKRVKRGCLTHSKDVSDHSGIEFKKSGQPCRNRRRNKEAEGLISAVPSDKKTAASNENEKKTEFSSTTGSHNEAIGGAASPDPSHSMLDATLHNIGRPSKKKESGKFYSDLHASPSGNIETVSRDHITGGGHGPKDCEGNNDLDTNMQKIWTKTVDAVSGNVDEVQKLDINSKKESEGMNNSDVKPLRSSVKKARGGNADGESSVKVKEQGRRQQAKIPESEEGGIRNINRKKKVSSVKSATKASTKDEIQVVDTPKTESKRKPSLLEKDFDGEIVGRKIRVWWPDDLEFYSGTIASFDPLHKKHNIEYDDGDVEILALKDEQWQFIDYVDEDKSIELRSPRASEMEQKKRVKMTSESSNKRSKIDSSKKGKRGGSAEKSKGDDGTSKSRSKSEGEGVNVGKSKDEESHAAGGESVNENYKVIDTGNGSGKVSLGKGKSPSSIPQESNVPQQNDIIKGVQDLSSQERLTVVYQGRKKRGICSEKKKSEVAIEMPSAGGKNISEEVGEMPSAGKEIVECDERSGKNTSKQGELKAGVKAPYEGEKRSVKNKSEEHETESVGKTCQELKIVSFRKKKSGAGEVRGGGKKMTQEMIDDVNKSVEGEIKGDDQKASIDSNIKSGEKKSQVLEERRYQEEAK